jgi:oligosaccharide repeat unit polymerase
MLIFVLGTGQRGGFVMFVLMWSVALVYVYKFYREETVKKALIVLVVAAVVLFGIMTIFNGRVANNSNVFKAVLKRIFDDNQECAVVAFRYIDSQPIQWGKDWFLSIKDILPGKNEYLQLSYVVFSIMYGSTRGTAPPCIWGSTYYNWGLLGIIIFPFILGFFYHRLYCKFLNKTVSKLRIFIFSAMFVVLGNWVADTPLVLFNQGFITLCLMKFLLVPDVVLTINGRPLNK